MKVGDVVRIVNLNRIGGLFELDEVVTISYKTNEKTTSPLKYKAFNKEGEEWWLSYENVKIIENLSDVEEFFNFLHPNMEITYRKELFDKLYKQFKQETK